MATSKSQEREAREARERLKRYNARQTVHATQVKRRKRDNLLAVVGVLLVAAAAAAVQVFYFTAGPGMPPPEPSASPSASAAPEANIGDVPSPAVAEARDWTGSITLNKTKLDVTLDGKAAPQGVASFITDIKNGYFDKKTCHRLEVQEGAQLIQCGSADGSGASDPDYSFGPLENVPADNVYKAGTIALARGATANSQGHQFFITFGDSTLQDAAGGYTVIGTVTRGLDELKEGIVAGGSTPDPTSGSGVPKIATTITSIAVK